jgi:hypothetical protein
MAAFTGPELVGQYVSLRKVLLRADVHPPSLRLADTSSLTPRPDWHYDVAAMLRYRGSVCFRLWLT